MKISAVVAVAHNNVMGNDNGMPWHLPADLKHLKKITMGHHILMGRKTFESIGVVLPGRTSVVLTRDRDYFHSGCIVTHSLEDALTIASEAGEEEAMIIGGGAIFKQALDYCDTIYLTEIDLEVTGDTFFPDIEDGVWELTSKKDFKPDRKNPYPYSFLKYIRREDARKSN